MQFHTLPVSNPEKTNNITIQGVYETRLHQAIDKPRYILEYEDPTRNNPLNIEVSGYGDTLGTIYTPPKTYGMKDVNLEPHLPSPYNMALDYLYEHIHNDVNDINEYQYNKVKDALTDQYDMKDDFYKQNVENYMKHYSDYIEEKNATQLDISDLTVDEIFDKYMP